MRRIASTHSPARQRGLALLVLLVLFAMAGTYMLLSSLNQGSTALALARAATTRAALQEAKTALIGWAASETSQPTPFQAGALPCPDINNDGQSDYSGPTCTRRLGRLPYKTLGISDLHDASGEILWYAVSSNFVRSTSNVINSDKLGGITISGVATASNVIAVVLAPGAALGTQNRSPGGTNTASNYLEGINGDANYDDYITAVEHLIDPVAANLFNDQLLAITQQDLFSIVEPVVAARIERDIVRQYIYDPTDTSTSTQWTDGGGPNKSRYFDAWGGFPFAAPFTNPGNVIVNSSIYIGQVGTYEGLLPVVDSTTVLASPFLNSPTYQWTLGSGSVVMTGGSGSISSFNCGATTSTNLRCTINSSGFISQPRFRMSGTVAGVGRSFVQLPRLTNVSTPLGSISSRSLSGSLTGAGAGIVMLDATMPLTFGGTTITVNINNGNLINSPLISSTDGIAGWFTANQWHKLTYYAVSPGYAGGAGSCNPLPTLPTPPTSPSCLGAANLAPPYTNPTTNTRAILILAGRSLTGASRPNGTLSDYLEAENASTGDYRFEHGSGKTTMVAGAAAAINDRVVVVAP